MEEEEEEDGFVRVLGAAVCEGRVSVMWSGGCVM